MSEAYAEILCGDLCFLVFTSAALQNFGSCDLIIRVPFSSSRSISAFSLSLLFDLLIRLDRFG